MSCSRSDVNCGISGLLAFALIAGAVERAGAGDDGFAGFEAAVLYDLPSPGNSIRAGDLDADGDVDLVLAHRSGNSLSVLFNNGDGTFESGPNMLVAVAMEDTTITDFDGDGIVDIIAVSQGSPIGEPFDNVGRVAILRGLGGGNFDEPEFYFAGTQPVGVASGDLNGDGRPDFVVTNQLSGDVAVFLNNDDNEPGKPVFHQVGSVPQRVALADMDLDGDLDAVVVNLFSDDLAVLLNDGSGALQLIQQIELAAIASRLAIGDINSDQLPDVATPTGGLAAVSLHLNQGNGTLSESELHDVGITTSAIGLTSINGGKTIDATPAGRNPARMNVASIRALFGDGMGAFPTMSSVVALDDGNGPLLDSPPRDQVQADFDNDDDIDLAIVVNPATIVAPQVAILLNATAASQSDLTGDGLVNSADLAELLRAWGQPGAADFDKSGAVDGRDLAHLLANWRASP